MNFPVSIPLRKTSSNSNLLMNLYYYPANPGMYPQGKGWSFVEFLGTRLKLDFHMFATSASSIVGGYL